MTEVKLRSKQPITSKAASIETLKLERFAFAKAIGEGRVATGEVNTVPVGKYAKASLVKLNLWDLVEPHLAMSENVRAALAFVARNEEALGIVYDTDAAAEPMVKIVAILWPASYWSWGPALSKTAACGSSSGGKVRILYPIGLADAIPIPHDRDQIEIRSTSSRVTSSARRS